jgi:superoxide dismutase, Fe-Mn family
MQKYETKTFNIPELKGISSKSIEEHLKLYEGYVKHTNLFLEEINKLGQNPEEHAFAISEMQRRFGFEYDGMKNHEIYFSSLSDGTIEITDGKLKKAIESEWGSFDAWLKLFKTIAKARGVGWAMLMYDKENNKLLNAWVDEQHLGHLMGAVPILALDMWEHSFVGDYWPSGKGQYIEDFFESLNWKVIEDNYNAALK